MNAAPKHDMWKHRGWTIDADYSCICTEYTWTATHPDYDGAPDSNDDRRANGSTYEELLDEIDMVQDDLNEANGQFGVGA
jgi:hypothetical protein